MPFTVQQFIRGADYTLETYRRQAPVDQINTNRPFLAWCIANRKDSMFGNGLFNNSVFMDNGSNFQRYFGAEQVMYNERDPARQATFPYVNVHEGFWFDEDRLKANNIVINDNTDEAPTRLEKDQLVNVLGESYRGMREGMQQGLALDALRDGSQSTSAVAGLDLLVSTTPTVGTIGDLAASNPWWQNNVALSIAQANLINTMEVMWRACMRYGGMKPTKIFCGEAFLDDYRIAAGLTINRRIEAGGNQQGGVSLDAGTTAVYFKGVELVWDPTFEALDTVLGVITHPWTKRCYFLNDTNLAYRPFKGSWMVNRKPERLPDRYVHYFAQTASYGMTTDKRNAMAVLTLD